MVAGVAVATSSKEEKEEKEEGATAGQKVFLGTVPSTHPPSSLWPELSHIPVPSHTRSLDYNLHPAQTQDSTRDGG